MWKITWISNKKKCLHVKLLKLKMFICIVYFFQPHLGKCFGNVKSLEITGGIVRKMISEEGEEIDMPKK